MSSRFTRALLLGVSALIWVGAVAKPLSVDLKWTPNSDTLAPPALDLTGGVYSLQIEKLVDKREKGNQIGENTEKKDVVPIITPSDVALFVTDMVIAQSKKTGIQIVGNGGDRVLKGELMEFWAQEAKNYTGSVRVKFMLVGTDGKEIWTGVVSGAGGNFGRSLKPLNYTETFTNALSDLIRNLYVQPGFASALKRR